MTAPTQSPPPPGARIVRITLRTAHLIAFGALYGGHVYGAGVEQLRPALLATVGTGGALMTLELYRTPLWLAQMRGLATLLKIILVLGATLWWDARLWLLTAAIIIGGISSHMPGRLRYYSIFHGRVIGGQEAG